MKRASRSLRSVVRAGPVTGGGVRRRRRALPGSVRTGLLLCVALGAARPVRAQEVERQAGGRSVSAAYREAFVEGRKLFAEGRWSEARTRFERAYAIEAEPLLLFNIASTYRREGNDGKALEFYRLYLLEAPAGDPYRGLAEKMVAEILASRESADAAPAPPVRQKAARAAAPPAAVQAPRVGARRPAAAARGRWLVWSGAGISLVGSGLLGWAAVEGWRARQRADELNGLVDGTSWSAALEARYDEGAAADRRARIGAVVGGTALAAGAALLVFGLSRRDEGERRLSAGPLLSPAGELGIAVRGDF
jgi:tetratricopeptide (TPR) repeat protein